MVYPEGPHLGVYFTKPINLKGFPQQGHVISCFLYSATTGNKSVLTSWSKEISSRIFSVEKALLGFRKP
jgi:hypothetical protein